jgi:hypothetical protein
MVTNGQEETPTEVYEQITCKFLGSTYTQTCYVSNIDQSCTGTDSCAMTIKGAEGSRVDIKACGGVAYATFDSTDETVEFNCETLRTERQISANCVFDEATQTKICDYPEVPNARVNVYEQVTCKFLGSTSTQTCFYPYIQDLSCTGADSCTMTIEGTEGNKVDIKACGGVAYVTLDSADETVEFNCEKNAAGGGGGGVNCVFDEATQTQKCYPAETATAPAAPVEKVKEQVKCVFLESKQLQKCYSEFGQSCEGETSCVMDIIGEKGRKATLKSSCGGYAYILLDGNNENAEFKCIPGEKVAPAQIVGRGFQRAAWECYDGTSSISQDVGCLPAEVWNKKAELYCEGHCYQDGSKCGVNSFSVLEECYEAVTTAAQPTITGAPQPTGIVATQPVVIAAAKPADLEKLKEEMEESKEGTLFCKDSCPLDGKCYPFGHRKGGEYCPDEGMFKEQLKSDEACDNNFECSTNVCVDGKCVSSGLIQKILNWLTKLFG